MVLLLLASIRFGAEVLLRPVRGVTSLSGHDLAGLLEESRGEREEEEARSRPLAPGETLDPNRSDEVQLDRLPGIGPAAARAWVATRSEEGGFRTPQDLLRVRGIGPATLGRIRPYLDFSEGIPVELRRGGPSAGGRGRAPPEKVVSEGTVPGGGPAPLIDLNRAGAEELQILPGIGPALAGRILEHRQREGPFREPEDLLKVRGIGPATLERIRSLVMAGG